MNPFLTGSRVYGTANSQSDVDLVLFLDPLDLDILAFLADPGSKYHRDYPGASLRFGKLNLICCTDEEEFARWKVGTQRLRVRAPVTRDTACQMFKALEKEAIGR